MTSFSAIRRRAGVRSDRRVVIIIYPGVTLLDATGPAQVFASANDFTESSAVRYQLVLASLNGGNIASDTGVTIGTAALRQAAAKPIDTLLVAGGLGVFQAAADKSLTSWIAKRAPTCRRVGSTCMGAFLTASAGLLSGRETTTHWRWCDELQRLHPDVLVRSDPIFIRSGPIWSSAGVTAGIDMALAMVEDDCGYQVSLKVARSLVVYLRRPGGQAQFSAALAAQSTDQVGEFSVLHSWIADHLDTDLRVETLAERVGMSLRTFARTYAARMGMTPAKFVEVMRVEGAKRLLQQDLSVASVALRVGFKDIERMRRAFLRHVGTSPSEYRRRFAMPSARSADGEVR